MRITDELIIKKLKELYLSIYKNSPRNIVPLTGGGSERKYYRFFGEKDITSIGVFGEDKKENETFLFLSRLFESRGINIPGIVGVSKDEYSYIIKDLGDVCLLDRLHEEGSLTLICKSIDQLIKVQAIPEELWINNIKDSPFSKRLVLWDLNYFKYCFLKPSGVSFNEDKLEDDYHQFADLLLDKENNPYGLMYRDFQSRNIMIYEDEPYLIDYQGARLGPVIYDIVSFIWQAKANFSESEKEDITAHYLERLSKYFTFELDGIKKKIRLFALFRTLQVLGAYGFRGLIQQKKHFIESIPAAVKNLKYLIKSGYADTFTEIKEMGLRLIEKIENGTNLKENFNEKGKETPLFNRSISNLPSQSTDVSGECPLVLTINSFSFKKRGYPQDESGNGGGFVFDCRGMHNPGRYDQYKTKSGLDRDVIDFLEERGEINDFVEGVFKIVSPVINRYIDRNFTSLQVNFGCTGGQHRSVRSAELFAAMVRSRFPGVRLKICHLERENWVK